MSAQQFMEMLFGRLPEFFKDEVELRALWSAPATRKKLLQGLAEKGFGGEQPAEMQKVIDAEKSDLFDVLAHVAYALPPVTREERAAHAKVIISTHFNSKQQVFLDFVLSHYVRVSIADALADLGRAEDIGRVLRGLPEVPVPAGGLPRDGRASRGYPERAPERTIREIPLVEVSNGRHLQSRDRT